MGGGETGFAPRPRFAGGLATDRADPLASKDPLPSAAPDVMGWEGDVEAPETLAPLVAAERAARERAAEAQARLEAAEAALRLLTDRRMSDRIVQAAQADLEARRRDVEAAERSLETAARERAAQGQGPPTSRDGQDPAGTPPVPEPRPAPARARHPALWLASMLAGVVAAAVGLAILAATHGGPWFGPPADTAAAPASPPVPADARRLRAASGAPVLGPGRRPGAFAAFRDCADCLDMVALPGGTFTMGSPRNEPGRDHDEDQVKVTLPAFAISRFPVTRGQYAAFAAATGRATEGGCVTDRAKTGEWALDPVGTWRDPAFLQDDNHPVVCVDWDDAVAYAAWMKARTGRGYRLPSEAEYEYANRAGTRTAYFWGQDGNAGCAHANIADAAAKRAFPRWVTVTCDDGYERTSPVGHFRANPWGLFDMAGNVWSWTADCYLANYASNPRDGRPYAPADCDRRVVRGASWYFSPWDARAASRDFDAPTYRDGDLGFRLARTLSPAGR